MQQTLERLQQETEELLVIFLINYNCTILALNIKKMVISIIGFRNNATTVYR